MKMKQSVQASLPSQKVQKVLMLSALLMSVHLQVFSAPATIGAGLNTNAISAPISEVTIYPGSATIARTAQVVVGSSQIQINGLPANFDMMTLHAEGSTGVQIGEIITKDVSLTEALSANEMDLEAKILAIKDKQDVLNAEIKSQQIVSNFIERLGGDSNNSSNSDKGNNLIDTKKLAATVELIGSASKQALLKIQTLNIQKRELQIQLEALQRELARQHSGNKDARNIIVTVNAQRAGVVKLSYQVKNAGWKPAYRASLDSSSSQAELNRLAIVSQKTGEDWSNVKLVLSTNQPNSLPINIDPQPWLVGFIEPRAESASFNVAQGMRVMAAPAPAPSVMGKLSRQRADADDYFAAVFESQSTFSTNFDVPARVNILADGREVSLTLGTQQLAVKQFIKMTPRLSNNALVMAEAPRSKGVWLRGNVQLFRDGNYVGASNWNPDASDKFTFSFGRDDLVKVENVTLKNDNASSGVFDKKADRHIANQFTITNAHSNAIDIQVLEASPVATSDNVKIKSAYSPQPNDTNWQDKRGVVAWSKKLNANEAAQFTVNYEVSVPKEGQITGL